MSRQSEAKERQGYNPKPMARVCANCANYKSVMDWPLWMKSGRNNHLLLEMYKVESNKHCGLGGFAVKKSGCCCEWEEAVNGQLR